MIELNFRRGGRLLILGCIGKKEICETKRLTKLNKTSHHNMNNQKLSDALNARQN